MFAQFALFASLALAKTIEIGVGEGGLVFKPNSVTAAVGDVLSFEFYPRMHSVVQGTFDKPCAVSGPDAIFSGYYAAKSGTNGTVFNVAINNTEPIWFYCSEGKHCQSGMAMVVNPPAESTGHTLEKYMAAAKDVKTNEEPQSLDIKGGVAVMAGAASPAVSSGAASGAASGVPTSAGASQSAASTTAAPSGSSAAAGSAASSTRSVTGGAPAATGFGVAAGAIAAGLAALL